MENSVVMFNTNDEENVSFCSYKAETPEEKAKLFEIMNNPEKRLSDCINQTILVKDLFAELVDCTNEETGEVTKAPRIVLIDKNGIGYQCVSAGVFGALKKLMSVYGIPTWESPIPLKIKQIKNGKKSLLTFSVEKQ